MTTSRDGDGYLPKYSPDGSLDMSALQLMDLAAVGFAANVAGGDLM